MTDNNTLFMAGAAFAAGALMAGAQVQRGVRPMTDNRVVIDMMDKPLELTSRRQPEWTLTSGAAGAVQPRLAGSSDPFDSQLRTIRFYETGRVADTSANVRSLLSGEEPKVFATSNQYYVQLSNDF